MRTDSVDLERRLIGLVALSVEVELVHDYGCEGRMILT
jgi:hypothetical protein